MVARIVYHVLPHPRGGWVVRRGRAARSSVATPGKAAAITAATRLAKGHNRSQVVIHAADGTIAGDRIYDGQLGKRRKVRTKVRKMLRTRLRKKTKRRQAAKRGVKTRRNRVRREALRRSKAAKRGAARRNR